MTAILCFDVGSASLKVSGYAREGRSVRRVFAGGQDAVDDADRATIRHDDEAEGAVRAEGATGDDGPKRWDGIVRAPALGARGAWRRGRRGHRIVHGGERTDPAHLTDALVDEPTALAPRAPMRQNADLAPARLLRREASDLAQVAVLDTAFHATMPGLARAMPRPEGALRGLQRHGFHGLSCRSLARRLSRLGPAPVRVMAAHLSGGTSVCAMRDGRSVDASMGATPPGGVMMGSRWARSIRARSFT